jgi:uncharacterized membrane protein YdfJ with MMPL/SSD domain
VDQWFSLSMCTVRTSRVGEADVLVLGESLQPVHRADPAQPVGDLVGDLVGAVIGLAFIRLTIAFRSILVDATLVRMILVPSIMQLLGNANWRLLHSSRRRLPDPAVTPDAPAPQTPFRF